MRVLRIYCDCCSIEIEHIKDGRQVFSNGISYDLCSVCVACMKYLSSQRIVIEIGALLPFQTDYLSLKENEL